MSQKQAWKQQQMHQKVSNVSCFVVCRNSNRVPRNIWLLLVSGYLNIDQNLINICCKQSFLTHFILNLAGCVKNIPLITYFYVMIMLWCINREVLVAPQYSSGSVKSQIITYSRIPICMVEYSLKCVKIYYAMQVQKVSEIIYF